jgi:dienelactone hydrolase
VEAWYPVAPQFARHPKAKKTTFGDYFANDPDLLVRTETDLLVTGGFSQAVIDANVPIEQAQFAVTRGSFRNAPISGGHRFPVVIYSHGTLQQRFTNDSMAENLARHGYIVLAPEHTGNDPLAPLGAYCGGRLDLPGVKPASLDSNPRFDPVRGEYLGRTYNPFFLVGSPEPATGTINPVEVALTLDRVGDYKAVVSWARTVFGDHALIGPGTIGLVGYSRGAMHGLVGAEIIPELRGSVSLVGGTPTRFFVRDAQAQPINDALATATNGRRAVLDRITKPVVEIFGGEDTRRKATTTLAAQIGVYPFPTAEHPSPIAEDTFANLRVFGALVRVQAMDHYDLVDDPFVIAFDDGGVYNAMAAAGNATRPDAYDSTATYVSLPVEVRKAIRDHYVLGTLDLLLGIPNAHRAADAVKAFVSMPFRAQGVTVTLK